jgi:hypothetical protein
VRRFIGYDRINAKAKYKEIATECRISLVYSEGFGMLKQGWLAYDFDSKTNSSRTTQVLVLLPTILTTGFQS